MNIFPSAQSGFDRVHQLLISYENGFSATLCKKGISLVLTMQIANCTHQRSVPRAPPNEKCKTLAIYTMFNGKKAERRAEMTRTRCGRDEKDAHLRGRGARIKRWLALRLGLLVVIATTTIYRNLSGQKCARTEAYKLFGDLQDERWYTRRRGPDRLARQVGNLRVDLNKSSQTYFLFSFALHANIMQKGKRRGPKYKELNGQSGGMQRDRRRGCRGTACTKWPVSVADAIASAISRCEVFAWECRTRKAEGRTYNSQKRCQKKAKSK